MDAYGGLLGMEPSDFQIPEEERRAIMRSNLLLGLGAGLLGSKRSQIWSNAGRGLLSGVQMGRQEVNDALKQRGSSLQQALQMQKLRQELLQSQRMNEWWAGAGDQGQAPPSAAASPAEPPRAALSSLDQSAPPPARATGNRTIDTFMGQARQLGIEGPVWATLVSDKGTGDGLRAAARLIAEASKPQSVGPGNFVWDPVRGVQFQAPNLDRGMAMGNDGRVAPLPGFPEAAASITRATKGAEAAAAADYDLVEIPVTENGRTRTVRMSRSQALSILQGGGGAPAPAAPLATPPAPAPQSAPQAPGGNPYAQPIKPSKWNNQETRSPLQILYDERAAQASVGKVDPALDRQIVQYERLGGGGRVAPSIPAQTNVGGFGVGEDPIARKLQEAAIDTAAAADRKTTDLALGQIDTSYNNAGAAANAIATVHDARRILDSGKVISGAGADFRLNFARAMSLAGDGDAKAQVAATQSYAATIARTVLSTVKNLGAGAGISNADRDFAAKVEGGDIALDEASMRKLLELSEKSSRAVINSHNKRTETGATVFDNPRAREFFKVTPPDEYAPPDRAAPKLTPAATGNRTVQWALEQAMRAGDQAAIDAMRRKGLVQ